MEATPGFEPGVKALQASALPLGHVATLTSCWPASASEPPPARTRPQGRLELAVKKAGQAFTDRPFSIHGADNGVRTRDPHLGKVVLYQLSHVRVAGKYIIPRTASTQEIFQESLKRDGFMNKQGLRNSLLTESFNLLLYPLADAMHQP